MCNVMCDIAAKEVAFVSVGTGPFTVRCGEYSEPVRVQFFDRFQNSITAVDTNRLPPPTVEQKLAASTTPTAAGSGGRRKIPRKKSSSSAAAAAAASTIIQSQIEVGRPSFGRVFFMLIWWCVDI